MRYAGNHKYLTYSSLILSVVSAVLGLIPFVFIFFIILDEATAFADPENEYLVQKAFGELSKNKTVIMIAHRLTTVRNADKIYVLKDGEITESGTHDTLNASGGLYAKMWQDYQTSIGWKVGGAV